MVTFAEYVGIAYSVARSRPWYQQRMKGQGTQPAHNRFMSQLADAYEANGHQKATRQQARSFLEEAVGPP